MKPTFVDTSVWIDALNGKSTWQVSLLEHLIDTDAVIIICPTIVQEVLQGIKEDKQYEAVKYYLSGFQLVAIEPLQAAYGASALYRTVRKKGITIRKSNDCLIAYHCISIGATLLHNDSDFEKISTQTTLKTKKPES